MTAAPTLDHVRPDPRAALAARWHAAVVSGPDAGWCVPLGDRPVVLGRDPSCDLHLADRLVSRRHLELRTRGGAVLGRDVGSANGTRRLRRRPARPTRLGRRWQRLPAGTRLAVGASEVVVRPRPGLSSSAAADARRPRGQGRGQGQRPSGGPAAGAAPDGSARHRWASGALGPVILSMAGVLPVLALSGAGGVPRGAALGVLLVALVAVPLLARTGRRRPWSPPALEDPAAVLLAACGGGVAGPPGGRLEVVVAGVPVDPLADGPLALVGAPGAVRAAARWLVGAAAVGRGPAGLAVRTPSGAGWPRSWTGDEPVDQGSGGQDGGGQGTAPELVAVDLLDGPTPGPPGPPAPRGSAVVLVPALEAAPPWCRRVIEVGTAAPVGVDAAWLAAVADGLARAGRSGPALQTDVAAETLLEDPAAAWPAADDGLRAAFAVTAVGPLEVDLARDGPHALVAGTTGSGKSELLTTWLLSLASRYPPSALVVVAVDYKGGATFGPLAGLPHLAGLLTDLAPAATARAIDGLRAELARREEVLAAAGARDLADLRARRPGGPVPPRVLVVVDEFRVLADEHPELLAALVRVAAQGRSLGLHLVLATQRPAGAVTADMRANLAVCVCLRVLTAGDSADVLGTAAAARLPAVPGRALVSGVAGAAGPGPVAVQAAWSGPGAARVEATVEAIRAVAERRGDPPATPLWAPPLPERAHAGDVTVVAPGRLPLLLLDEPGRQRLTPWSWTPQDGPLLVVGTPGSGRTTALHALAAAALAQGLATHLVGLQAGPAEATAPALGTVVGPDDPRRLVRLLELLHRGDGPALVCLDGAEAVAAACDAVLGPGGGLDRLAALLRAAAGGGPALVITADLAAASARWTAAARHRLVLGGADPLEAGIAGVPAALRGGPRPPGRGVLLGRAAAPVGAHVLLPDAPGARPGPPPSAPGRVHRLLPVPLHVPSDAARRHPEQPDRLLLGLGGDDAGPVRVPSGPAARVVVAGPAESGRTATLAHLARGAAAAGADVTWVDGAATGSAPAAAAQLGAAGVLVVDDADALPREAAERLARRWTEPVGPVLVSARSSALALGLHGPLACLREARAVVVLAPLHGGTAHLAASDVLPHADPAHPRHPGRGVLVEPRRAVPVQVPGPG